jgi:hypothetical protein
VLALSGKHYRATIVILVQVEKNIGECAYQILVKEVVRTPLNLNQADKTPCIRDFNVSYFLTHVLTSFS